MAFQQQPPSHTVDIAPKTFDARFKHPFTAIVNGPSGAGKTTFVQQLLMDKHIIDCKFDKIYIFIGTPIEQNKIFLSMMEKMPQVVEVVNLKEFYPNLKKSKFTEEMTGVLDHNNSQGLNTCVVFDDLMSEMSELSLLGDLFSRLSTHTNTSVINLTQNLFHRGVGSNNVTVFRNAKLLILFKNKSDKTIFRNLAMKQSSPRFPVPNLVRFFEDVTNKYRYVSCHFNFDCPEELTYRTDLFATEPFRHIKVVTPLPKA